MLTTVNTPPTNHVKVLNDQGWIGLLNSMGTEADIVNAARVSFGKMKTEVDEKDIGLMKYLLDNHHNSPFEHIQFTFSIHCPLFIRSQWHRHRTWSYNEISRRYTSDDLEFFVPHTLRRQSTDNKQASEGGFDIEADSAHSCLIYEANQNALSIYNQLIAHGVCREQARGVLPQNLMTTFWATVDLKNLMDFLELRDHPHAQIEIREYAQAIKKLIAPGFPNLAKLKGW